MSKPLSERELVLYRFYLKSIINKTPIPPFKIITSTVLSEGNHQYKENAGEASRATSDLVHKGLIRNTKVGSRAFITILPLTSETKEIVPDDLQPLVEQAIKAQQTSSLNGNSYKQVLSNTNTKAKRKFDSSSDTQVHQVEKENTNPTHRSAKIKRLAEVIAPTTYKTTYETYCLDIKSQIKSSPLAAFKLALISFYDLHMLKKLDPQVDFPRRFLPMLDGNDVFHGFEWLDLALQYEEESAQEYFRDILSERTPLTTELKKYYQQIKQHAHANLEFAERAKYLFKEETEYYKDNETEATLDY